MTREEAISRINNDLECHKKELSAAYKTALNMAIEALKFCEVYDVTIKAVNKHCDEHHTVIMDWIPCSERLPENDEDVLITNNWHEVRMAYLSDRTVGKVLCWIVDHNSYHPVDRNEIIAWMPLPQPMRLESDL